jgi:cysteine sulfinate desulfinase/cysteine desulfurase-like protein
MNVPKEYINGTIRISIGNNNTEEEIKFVAKRIKENVELLRRYKG